MAKTLIIRGADFSGHYVDQVVFAEVPCTGIELNKSTATLATTTATETLTATVTPANTTDTVIWSSSDTDVAVVAAGVVTPVGLGTAVITAQCGEYSATCTVTCEGAVDFKYSIGAFLDVATNSRDYIRVASTSATDGFAIGLASGTYHATDIETADGWLYPIPIPKNAQSISARCMTQYFGINALYFLKSTQESTSMAGAAQYTFVRVSGSAVNWGDKTYQGRACYGNDINLPVGDYDSVVIRMKQNGSAAVKEADATSTYIWFNSTAV